MLALSPKRPFEVVASPACALAETETGQVALCSSSFAALNCCLLLNHFGFTGRSGVYSGVARSNEKKKCADDSEKQKCVLLSV
jgi:hypothetical protein